MNILIVNIGSTCIMKEPLSLFNGEGTKEFNSNTTNLPSKHKTIPIVKPKFSHETSKSKDQQQETMTKIRTKTDLLGKILNLYFEDKNNESHENSLITEIQADIMKQNRNNDFTSFQAMISILSIETKDDYSFYSTMTKAQYEALTSYQKFYLMNSISKAKYSILTNHFKLFESSPTSLLESNVWNETKQQPEQNRLNTINNKKSDRTFFDIQNELFRKYINKPNFPEEQIKSYVNMCNGDVLKGVDIYFQSIFKLSMLTLRYIYENNEEIIHYFSFTTEAIELMKVVKEDRPFINDFTLLTFEKKEIDIDANQTRLVGTIDLINNSSIMVIEKNPEVSLDL